MTNPTKRNAYRLIEQELGEVLEPADIMAFQLPDVETETDEHYEDNHARETPSSVRVGDAELVVYEDVLRKNPFFLRKVVYNQETGAMRAASDYEFTLIVQQLAPDHETPIREWALLRCWLKQSSFERFERSSTENQQRTLTISVHKMVERQL